MANIPFLNNAYFAAKVGIGIETPGGNLHVVGDTGSSGQIYLSDRDNGTGTGDALLINKSGASAFIYNRDGGQLSFGTNNVSNNLVIANTGNVGIGTTSPGVPLDVTGIIRTTTSFVGNASIVNQITAATSSGSIKFKNNSGADRAIITDAGNVGIGTTGPDKKLEVSGDIKISGGDYNGLFFENASGTTKTLLYQHASYDALVIKDIVNNADRVTFKNNGNVGIGTTSPSEKLDIEGNVRVGQNNGFYINNQNVGIKRDSNDLVLGGFGNVIIKSSSTTVVNQAERMRITSAGNVGIGTTSPDYKLDVEGDISLVGGGENYAVMSPISQGMQIAVGDPADIAVPLVTFDGENQRVGIGTTNPAAKLDIESTTSGVLLPRMTTAQVNAISSPSNGLTVYNTTLNTLCFYNGSSWQKVNHANM